MKLIQDDEKTLVGENDTDTHQDPQYQNSRQRSQSKDPQHQAPLINPPDIFQLQDHAEEVILQLTYEIQQLRLDYIIGIRQFSLDYAYLSAKKRLQMIQDLNVRQAVVVAKDVSLSLAKENLPLQKRLFTTTTTTTTSSQPLEMATWKLVPYPPPPAPRTVREEIKIGGLGTTHHLESHLHPLARGDLYWTRRYFRKGKGEPKGLIPDHGDEAWARDTTSLIKAVRACIPAQKCKAGESRGEPVALDDRRVVVLLILQAGVIREERDVHGMTALEYARLEGEEFLIAILESPELPLFAQFLLAISEGETEEVRCALETNSEVYSLLLDRGVSGLAIAGRRANEKVAAYVAYLEHSNRAAAGEESVYAGVVAYYGIIKILLRCEGVGAECDVVEEVLEQVERGVFADQNPELIELLHSVRKSIA